MSANVSKISSGNQGKALSYTGECLIKAGMPDQKIKQVLRVIGLHGCETPFTEEEIDDKIKAIINGKTSGIRSWEEEIKELIVSASGSITTAFVFNCLQVSARSEKKIVYSALARLAEKGYLKKSQTVAGQYRIVKDSYEEEDWGNASLETLDIRLPFGIERYVEIAPGDLILVSGVRNSGKSSFCFEFTKLNMKRFPVYYFSSELNKSGFKKRILKSNTPLDVWTEYVTFSSKWENPVDIIQPDAFNIIDYVEAPDGEYFKIPPMLTEIHKALNTGIAVCCLQKKKDVEWGVGGEQVESKPSLSITLDNNFPYTRLRISKAKDYKNSINPNGFFLDYKIVDGIKLLPEGVLEPE